MNFFCKVTCIVILFLFLSAQTAWVEELGVTIYFSRCSDITPDQILTENDFILEPNSRQTFSLLSIFGSAEDIKRILAQLVADMPIAGQSITQIGSGNTAVIKQGS